MSRFRRAVHGVASSYLLLFAGAMYSLASVPVALHYLDKQRFGLWVLMGTLAGYLSLIDAGVTSAAARLLIDYKDDRNGGGYGGLIKTGWIISCAQGFIILAFGVFLAGFFARILAIPRAIQPEFFQLVYWQSGGTALVFGTRMLSLILDAHQRMDLGNYIGIGGFFVVFPAQWILFHYGFGVISLAMASILSNLVMIAAQALACSVLKLFPQSGQWGAISWFHSRELFSYGKDLFLVGFGAQLIMTSQTIIITRTLGLEAAAVWGVGIRVYNLVNQVVWRVSDMSASALAEMLARRENSRLLDRYRNLAILTFAFAGWAAVSFATCNSLFIAIWTGGKIHWPAINNVLLAIWMILSVVVHCHNCFILLTKQVGFMRYVYFVEGTVFVVLAVLFSGSGGLAAVIACSILCTSIFTCPYGIWRVSRFFQISVREVAFDWLRPMRNVLIIYLPLSVAIYWLFASASVATRLGINGLLSASLGAYLFVRYGIPISIKNQLLDYVPAKTIPFLKRVFVQS